MQGSVLVAAFLTTLLGMCIIGTAGNTIVQEILADGPVSYWPLEDNSNTIQTEEIAGRNIPLHNNPTISHIRGAEYNNVQFNGVNQFGEYPYTSVHNPPSFTVVGWAYVMGGSGSWRSPFTSRSASSGLKGWLVYAGTDEHWQTWTGNGGWVGCTHTTTVSYNVWTHIAVTRDSSNRYFYINGASISCDPSYVPNPDSPLRIGAGATESSFQFPFNGIVEHVAIYNKALSASRIAAHYSATYSSYVLNYCCPSVYDTCATLHSTCSNVDNALATVQSDCSSSQMQSICDVATQAQALSSVCSQIASSCDAAISHC